MAKPEWGVKRVCQSCAVKFYDLNRSPITCPKCAAPFDPEALLKSRRSRSTPPAKAAKPEPAAAPPPADGAKPDDGAGAGADTDANTDADTDADTDTDSNSNANGAGAARPDDDEDDDLVLQDTSELGDDGVSEVAVTGEKDDG